MYWRTKKDVGIDPAICLTPALLTNCWKVQQFKSKHRYTRRQLPVFTKIADGTLSRTEYVPAVCVNTVEVIVV